MATNKWLEGLKTLENKRKTVCNIIKEKGIAVNADAPLVSMLDKISLLKDINEDDGSIYTPDPLWKFPDPNGTSSLKTIREIYDEDPLAANYKYRGIYLIQGKIDSIDLKEVMGKRTSSDTFITSDGCTYTNVIDTSLIHTWNKSYDVIDSDENIVRYIKIYSDSSYSHVPGFYNQLIWGIHNFSSTIHLEARQTQTMGNSEPYAYSLRGCPLKILELYKVQTLRGAYTSNVKKEYEMDVTLGDPRILKFHEIGTKLAPDSTYSALMTSDMSLEYLYLGIKDTTTDINLPANANAGWRTSWYCAPNFKKLDININEESNTLKTFKICLPWNYKDFNFLDKLNNVNILELYGPGGTNYLYIPLWIKSLKLSKMASLTEVDLSSNINLISLNLQDMRALRKLTLPNSLTSLTWTDPTTPNTLVELYVGENYNIATNLSYCINLKHESIVDLLNKLKDLNGDTAKTLTLGATNLAKLTAEEKAIATNKNWKLA